MCQTTSIIFILFSNLNKYFNFNIKIIINGATGKTNPIKFPGINFMYVIYSTLCWITHVLICAFSGKSSCIQVVAGRI